MASYAYSYDTSGNLAAQNIALGGVSTNIVLGSTWDYNGNRTELAVNIGGSATFDDNGDFTGFTSGDGITNDFKNVYGYDKLGDMTSITQAENTSGTYKSVTSKEVDMTYDDDQRLEYLDMKQGGGSSTVGSASFGYDDDADLTDLKYTTGLDGAGSTLAA